MKKLLSVLLAVVMCAVLLAGCSSGGGSDSSSAGTSAASKESGSAETEDKKATGNGVAASDIKVGVIYIGDENEGYTEAHMKGIQDMKQALGLSDAQVIEKTTIPESTECYDAAADLAGQGCNIIFGTSFGHEDYMIQAAGEYPEVQFCHATGFKAATSGLANMHNYFTNVYESRYVSGVVAGMKIQEMIDKGEITAEQAKMGYVGAFNYAEVVSGYTAFYLGAKSVCSSVTMEVKYTSSWADMALEKETAEALIADGCILVSQHSDTTGAATACEAKKVPIVGYNVDMISTAPNYALTSATINWAPYYTYAVQSIIDGTEIDTDWCKGYAEDADGITELNEKIVAAGTDEKVAEVEKAIKDGSLRVFDTSTFTVNGSSIEDLIQQGGDYAKYEAYVSEGYFHESEVTSAPAFDLRIDGITES